MVLWRGNLGRWKFRLELVLELAEKFGPSPALEISPRKPTSLRETTTPSCEQRCQVMVALVLRYEMCFVNLAQSFTAFKSV
jgi:hypothetical protein